MRVALVGPELEENLGLRYIDATVAQAGHETRIFDFHAEGQVREIAGRIAGYRPDLVGLSMVFTGRAREFIDLARELRAAGYRGHMTAGGHFASFNAPDLLRHSPALDSVVHGEGETVLVELLDHLDSPEGPAAVAGVSFRDASGAVVRTGPRRNPDDLDSLPWPTRPDEFHTYLGMPIANMLSSRGCYANCSFCSISAWFRETPGRRLRLRAVTEVAREMASLYHERGVRIFNFHDDNFFLPSKRASIERFEALDRELDRLGVDMIAVQVKARPDSVDRDVVAALKGLGLFRVFLGVESNAVMGLKTLGRGITRDENHRAIRILGDAGIHTTYNLLMFDPECTISDLRDNVAFIEEYAEHPLNFGRVEVYARTPLEKRLCDEGRLLGDMFGYDYIIADPRAQLAFDVFRHVFWGRNFEDDGMNHMAMKVDYHFHILRHFRPERAGTRIERRAKGFIAGLNRNSVEILGAILDFAERADVSGDAAAGDLARRLLAEREAFDEDARRRQNRIIGDIERLASSARSRRGKLPYVASAAAAVVIGVTGCTRHATELMPEPARPSEEKPKGKEEKSKELDAEAVGKIMKRVNETYLAEAVALGIRNRFGGHTVDIDLTLDESGKVLSCWIRLPKGVSAASFEAALGAAATKWNFPSAGRAGECTVSIAFPPITDIIRPPDWHMFEMMMRPPKP